MNTFALQNPAGRAIGPALLAIALVGTWCGMAAAYVPDNRWSSSASGGTGSTGDPITLSWSLVRDGTNIVDEGASNLISYLDGQFGAGSGGTDLTQRPWFPIFQESFDRWSQLASLSSMSPMTPASAPCQHTRCGATFIGGALNRRISNTLAYTYLPSVGDMVVDTGSRRSSPARRAIIERFATPSCRLGHAIGLQHVESSTTSLLMEPFIDTSFDGPQR
jgi:hypothetical protein